MGSAVSLPPGFQLDQLPDGFEIDKPQESGGPTIGPAPEPHGIGEHIARWTDNVAHDLKYGTDLTGVGTVLKKMGAHGLNIGNSEKVGEFMGSLPLGILQYIKGHAEVGSGQPIQGIKDVVGGALQAGQIPSAFMGAPEAPAVVEGATSAAVRGAKAIRNIIPNVERAKPLFNQVEAAVGNVPVDLSKVGPPIFEAQRLEQTGGGAPPAVITKLAEHLPEHGGTPVPFRDARLFQQNASKLSVAESMDAKPAMHRQVSILAKALAEENERIATEGGVGDVYREAMREYKAAKRFEDFKDSAAEYAKKAAITALLGSAAYEGYKHF